MLKFCLLASIFILALSTAARAQSAHSLLRSGNEAYVGQDYKKAEEQYRKALEKKPSFQGQYNLGSAIYQQQRFDEALEQFQQAADQSKDPGVKANAFYNLGNAYFSKQQYQEAIEAYKNSLRLKPADKETQYNLSQALRQMQQQKQEQKEQQEQEEQQKKDQEQNSSEQKQQEGSPPPDQQEQQQNSNQQEQPQNPNTKPGQLSDEEAERLLDIMNREEEKVQEKMRKSEGNHLRPDRDW